MEVIDSFTSKLQYFCRRYVEKELFDSADQVPEKHNLSYYPTVNDLQNHIHQALKDIEAGVLPVTAPTVRSQLDHIKEKYTM